eukprot:s4174_g5.t1
MLSGEARGFQLPVARLHSETKPSRSGSGRGPGSKESVGRNDARTSRRGSTTAAALRRKDSMDSEVSEPCRFDGLVPCSALFV